MPRKLTDEEIEAQKDFMYERAMVCLNHIRKNFRRYYIR